MQTSITCPNPACGKTSIASGEVESKRVRCRHCGQTFIASSTTENPKAETRPASATQLPTLIGRFQIRAKLGAGAFGTVYRAYDPQLDREVALKVPNPGTLDRPQRIKRFLREAQSAAGLRHPHIVPIFDAGKDAERYYIASAFIAGKKLSDTVDENGTGFERAARLCRELAEALAYAHEQGIVHRDVKPDNIMVDKNDRIHLMDFGLAARQDDESKLTSDGSVMGTPSYMAPEQAMGQKGEAQPAADQYSAGIVLYELLTGNVPFRGPPAVVIHNQIHTEPEPPTRFRADTPRDLETICLKAIRKRPEERYPDCQAMADDLRRWSEGAPITARQLSTSERLVRWARRNKTVATLSGVLAALLLIGTIVTSVLAGVAGRQAHRASRAADSANEEAKRADAEAEAARLAQQNAERNAAEARDQTARADANLVEANRQRKTATEALEDAKKQAELARTNAARAQEERDAKERQLMLTSRLLYAANIKSAYNALRSGRFDVSRQSLAECARELRGWEYQYLRNLLNAGIENLPEIDDPVASLASATNGTVVIVKDKSISIVLADPALPHRSLTAVGIHKLEECAISPDGKIVAASGTTLDKSSHSWVWDVSTGKLIATPKTGRTISLSPNGKLLAARSPGPLGGVGIWKTEDGTLLKEINTGESPEVYDLVFSQDSSTVFALVRPKFNRRDPPIWSCNIATGEAVSLESKLPEKTSVVNGELSPGGQRILIEAGQTGLEVHSLGSKSPVLRLRASSSQWTAAAFSHDQKLLAVAGTRGRVEIFDLINGKTLQFLKGPSAAIRSLAFTLDNQGLISASDRGVSVWTLKVSEEKLLDPMQEASLTMMPDGRLIREGGDFAPSSVAMSRDGNWVAASLGRTPAVWNTRTGKKHLDLGTSVDDVSVLAFHPNSTRLFGFREHAGASKPSRYLVWDAVNRKLIKEIPPPEITGTRVVDQSFPVSIAFNVEGTLAADNVRSRIRFWDPDNPDKDRAAEGSTEKGLLAFHPGPAKVLLQNLQAFNYERKQVLFTLPVKDVIAKCMVYSGDGKMIALGTDAGTVELFDGVTGKSIRTLLGHGDAVRGVAFLPGRNRLVSGGQDRTLRIWDTEFGIEVLRLEEHQSPVIWLGVSQDGTVLSSAAADGVRVRRNSRPIPRP